MTDLTVFDDVFIRALSGWYTMAQGRALSASIPFVVPRSVNGGPVAYTQPACGNAQRGEVFPGFPICSFSLSCFTNRM